MKKNIILSVGLFTMQILSILISLFAAILVLIFVGSLVNDFPLQENLLEIQSLVLNESGGLQLHELQTTNKWLLYVIIFQNLLTLTLLFSILGYGIGIIRNIQRNKTFSKPTINAFDKVSQLAIILFFVKFIKLSPIKVGIGFEFSYLFLAFGAIILTQVFKEGHRLLKENELTV